MDIQEYISGGIIESYVLGLTSAAETAEVEQMAAAYPEIKQAIADFELQLENYAVKNAVAPPDHLRNTILNALSNLDKKDASPSFVQDIPVIPMQQETPEPVKKGSFLRYVAAASVILFIVSAAFNYHFYNKYQSANSSYQALLTERNSLQASNDVFKTRFSSFQHSLAIMEDPDYKVVKMTGIPGKEGNLATVYWNSATNEVYLFSNKLAAAPSDKQYQLWAIVNGQPVDAGMISSCDGVCTMKNIANAQAFAVTLEKKGGSPTPDLSAMYVMGKV